MELFDSLFEAVYDKTPGHYGSENMRKGYISSKGVFYDLSDIDIKTGPDEFRVPREHLDHAGKQAYLTGFFSGDGNVSVCRRGGRVGYMVRVYSSCREGLEGVRDLFLDLGFHPHEIHDEIRVRETRTETYFTFSIPTEEHPRFIHEIGSYNSEHRKKFEDMERRAGRDYE